MKGQRITLRVISDEFLPVQRLHKYRVEVVSKASPFKGKVDFVYSAIDISLNRGHTYFVRLGSEPQNPRIVKCFRQTAL